MRNKAESKRQTEESIPAFVRTVTPYSQQLSAYGFNRVDVKVFSQMYGEPDSTPKNPVSMAAETLIGLSELGEDKLNGDTINWNTNYGDRTRAEAARIVFTSKVGEATHVPQETIKKGKKVKKRRR